MSSTIKRTADTVTDNYILIPDGDNLPIAYRKGTSQKVIDVLEQARKNKTRIRLNYGDVETGKDWYETNDITGRIGLSKGTDARYPILIKQSNSIGGGSLLENRILKIRDTKSSGNVLYRAENYQQAQILVVPSDLPEYSHNVTINGEIFSRHKTLRGASLLQTKIS